MMYLEIDQHDRQLTISLRDESGDVIQARQVSTQPEKVQAFLTRDCAARGEWLIAVVEVCGFNDWLLKMLQDYRCHRVILIQPEERKKQKTDRRDASSMGELLWVNRVMPKPSSVIFCHLDMATPMSRRLMSSLRITLRA